MLTKLALEWSKSVGRVVGEPGLRIEGFPVDTSLCVTPEPHRCRPSLRARGDQKRQVRLGQRRAWLGEHADRQRMKRPELETDAVVTLWLPGRIAEKRYVEQIVRSKKDSD